MYIIKNKDVGLLIEELSFILDDYPVGSKDYNRVKKNIIKLASFLHDKKEKEDA